MGRGGVAGARTEAGEIKSLHRETLTIGWLLASSHPLVPQEWSALQPGQCEFSKPRVARLVAAVGISSRYWWHWQYGQS